MLKKLTTTEKMVGLADYIEANPAWFSMSDRCNCIYGYACRYFGVELSSSCDRRHLSELLNVSLDTASRLYMGHFDGTRYVAGSVTPHRAANELRRLALYA